MTDHHSVLLRGALFWADQQQPPAPAVAEDPVSDISAFRGLLWGATSQSVAEHEIRDPQSVGDDVIVYDGELNGYGVQIAYIFADDELVRAKYLVTEALLDDDEYVRAFSGFKDMLTEKYGWAVRDDEQRFEGAFAEDRTQWRVAVSRGEYARRTFWSRPSGDVCLALHSRYHRVLLEIEYSSRRHTEAKAERARRTLLAAL